MKTAKEMKLETMKNCPIIQYIEANIPQLIDEAVEMGRYEITLIIDDIPSRLPRCTICERIDEYLAKFGYDVRSTADSKKINISWDVEI